ncbi:putative aminotransferase [Xylophilus ampelinus]|nr:aminotransferase class III-fold pyridoxal phosphate-dependent enzyme [Variovorax sp.]VTY37156.1 putative aminotransferase [Xylophilus ampelinus]
MSTNTLTRLGALDAAHSVHPHTNLRRHLDEGPSIITRGDGIYVEDEQGRRYLEGAAGLWCAALGFGNARLGAVAAKVMTEIGYYHNFRSASTPAAAELSAKLAAFAPKGMDKVLLQCSGSEANDTALKLVWYHWAGQGQPQRRKIISRWGAYHGTGAITSCLTAKANFHTGFGLPFDGFLYTGMPYHYRHAQPGEDEQAFSTRLAAELEAMILEEGPETIAAFWAEPVMGSGGAITPPAGYFDKIQSVLRRYGILLVADEVICGFARTGEMWGSQTYGMQPDLICSAKSLSAAMVPISAVLIGERVFAGMVAQTDKLGSFAHGYTYGGHPMACAVAHEVLTIYEEMDLVGHVKQVEPLFLQGLAAMAERPYVGDARGVGLIGAVEIVTDRVARTMADSALMARIEGATRARGLIVRLVGNRIALSPPQIITAPQVQEMFERLGLALDDVFGRGG